MHSEKKMLVITNHPIDKWESAQKAGWELTYFPFPNVDPHLNSNDIKLHVDLVIHKILNFVQKNTNAYVCLQGEFSVCYRVFTNPKMQKVKFIFPTTERVVVEKGNEKYSVFRFVQWR